MIRSVLGSRRSIGGPLGSVGAPQTYTQKVLGYSPVAYWPLNELSGTTADNLGSIGASGDGVYTGVTLGSIASPVPGDTAPRFDGVAGDNVNIYSAALNAAWNWAEYTIAGWFRWVNLDTASEWGMMIASGNANRAIIYAPASAGTIQAFTTQNGVTDFVNSSGNSDDTWYHIVITYSVSNDRMKMYRNGLQVGATQTGVGSGAVGLANGWCNIGSNVGAVNVLDGYASHVNVFDSELDGADIADLATV